MCTWRKMVMWNFFVLYYFCLKLNLSMKLFFLYKISFLALFNILIIIIKLFCEILFCIYCLMSLIGTQVYPCSISLYCLRPRHEHIVIISSNFQVVLKQKLHFCFCNYSFVIFWLLFPSKVRITIFLWGYRKQVTRG